MSKAGTCICEGNKALRDLQHMRELARKAAQLDDEIMIIYRKEDTYHFCQETEYEAKKGELIEYIYP